MTISPTPEEIARVDAYHKKVFRDRIMADLIKKALEPSKRLHYFEIPVDESWPPLALIGLAIVANERLEGRISPFPRDISP